MIIAIDGPGGAGKGTIAKAIAKKLNIVYIDTGAMYRSVGLYAKRNNIGTRDGEALKQVLDLIKIDVKVSKEGQRFLLNGEDVSEAIRTPEISMAASDVSSIPEVRERLVDMQREMAKMQSVVMEGRDIGTVVFPNADKKIYLTASPEVRARRRYNELIAKGQEVEYETVLEELIIRDRNDSTRETSPLRQAEDAVVLDTTDMTLPEAIARTIEIIQG